MTVSSMNEREPSARAAWVRAALIGCAVLSLSAAAGCTRAVGAQEADEIGSPGETRIVQSGGRRHQARHGAR